MNKFSKKIHFLMNKSAVEVKKGLGLSFRIYLLHTLVWWLHSANLIRRYQATKVFHQLML